MTTIDLHTHSVHSDGTDTPSQIVVQAAAAQVDVLALTDHDTTSGWEEATAACAEHGILFVPGIELSTKHRGMSVHLLAYWPDAADPDLLAIMDHSRHERQGRARAMVAALEADGLLTWPEVEQHLEPGATIGRPHIADAMVARGAVQDRSEAFERYLFPGSPYYVFQESTSTSDAITAVRSAGGVSVIAHPGAFSRGRILSDSDIRGFADLGLVGLEVQHRDNDEPQRVRLASLAEELGLVTTGSSDFHGTGKPNLLAENTTSPEQYARLRERRESVAQ